MIVEDQSLFTRIGRRVALTIEESFLWHIVAWWVIITVFVGLAYLLGGMQ